MSLNTDFMSDISDDEHEDAEEMIELVCHFDATFVFHAIL